MLERGTFLLDSYYSTGFLAFDGHFVEIDLLLIESAVQSKSPPVILIIRRNENLLH